VDSRKAAKRKTEAARHRVATELGPRLIPERTGSFLVRWSEMAHTVRSVSLDPPRSETGHRPWAPGILAQRPTKLGAMGGNGRDGAAGSMAYVHHSLSRGKRGKRAHRCVRATINVVSKVLSST